MNILKYYYFRNTIPKLYEIFNYSNIHRIPKVDKICLNTGLGIKAQNESFLKKIIEDIRQITGQHPKVTLAKKAISGFKLRKGVPIGLKVTLRKNKMYAFLEKLIKLVLPKIRDFRGLSITQFDKKGNYNLGIIDALLFPEMEYDILQPKHGFNITIVTTAKNRKEGFFLLNYLGIPFNQL